MIAGEDCCLLAGRSRPLFIRRNRRFRARRNPRRYLNRRRISLVKLVKFFRMFLWVAGGAFGSVRFF